MGSGSEKALFYLNPNYKKASGALANTMASLCKRRRCLEVVSIATPSKTAKVTNIIAISFRPIYDGNLQGIRFGQKK